MPVLALTVRLISHLLFYLSSMEDGRHLCAARGMSTAFTWYYLILHSPNPNSERLRFRLTPSAVSHTPSIVREARGCLGASVFWRCQVMLRDELGWAPRFPTNTSSELQEFVGLPAVFQSASGILMLPRQRQRQRCLPPWPQGFTASLLPPSCKSNDGFSHSYSCEWGLQEIGAMDGGGGGLEQHRGPFNEGTPSLSRPSPFIPCSRRTTATR